VQLKKLVDLKLQALQDARLKITVRGKEIVVREQVSKIFHAIISAKDIIGSAISAEPCAALAWAGVLVVLPVSLFL
jgi:N-terminal domain of NWD NACHT-NTPase